ncbi:MAG: ribonuclease HI [Planctomycetota bacterium]|jgi:ribonuclease HI
MQKISIYTDGACSGNPGPGGWGAVLICHEPPATKEINGAEFNTTNNRMEMMGVISALELLKVPCDVTITTDSRYVCDAFRKNWIRGWLKNGWKTASKQPVKNQELWERMLTALEPHQVSWEWVKGHNEHPENERADALAVEAREAIAIHK